MPDPTPPAAPTTPAQPPVTPPAAPAEPTPPANPPATPPGTPATPPAAPAEPTPPATPPAAPPIGPDGKLAENWFLALGDEFAPHAKDLSKHKDIRSLITELDYYRKNGVEYPGDGAVPQAVERFRKIAGVPETPEGYGITAESVQLPAGMEFDAELAQAITAAAHKTHTPPAALQAIVGEFNNILANRQADAAKQAEAAKKAAQDQLVAEWRGDFAANASTVRHLAATFANEAGILPDDPGLVELANNPTFARLMFQVSRRSREDTISVPSGFGSLKSPAQQIAEIKAGTDPVWGQKWVNGTREEKAAAYQYVKALQEKIQ